jgi:eukaryotic-like serine/threonine-protein kinase
MARAAETIAGRYELHDVLGRGGMSVVHRATDRVLDRTVAVKVLPAAYAENPVLVERFSREARAVARLSHPNIVGVYDSGFDRTVHYIVMECVPGVSLAQLLKDRGPLPLAHAVEIATQVALALAAAHEARIVHRDIKPANVMVQPSGTVKVLDFGIARARDDADLTRTTTVLGSAPYMAPEVAMGGSADERSDIYSLGCVLYEMLTGRPPFMADVPLAVMHLHANATPEPVRKLRPEVPEGLAVLVLQMLAKEPDDRPQRATQLVSALREAVRDDAPRTAPTLLGPTRVAPPPPPAPPEDRPATTAPPPPAAAPPAPPPEDTAAMPGPGKRSSGRVWLFATAALVALAAGIAVALASSSSSNHEHTTSGAQSHPRTSSSTSASSSSSPSSSSSTTSTTRTSARSTTTSASTSSTTSSPASSTSTSSSTSTTQPASTSRPPAASPTTTAP